MRRQYSGKTQGLTQRRAIAGSSHCQRSEGTEQSYFSLVGMGAEKERMSTTAGRQVK